MNHWCAWIIGAVLACGAGAGACGGVVEMRDGQRHEGTVTLEAPATVVVGAVKVPLGQVRRAVVAPSTRPATWTSFAEGAKTTPGGQLPAGWASQDIGKVKEKGGATFDASAGAFEVRGSGWGVWGYDDAFHFAYTRLEGEGQVLAHVSKVNNPAGTAMAVLNLRDSVNAEARQVSVAVNPFQIRFNSRPIPGANHAWGEEVKPPAEVWLRLTRRGKMFVGYQSKDGRFWRRVDQRELEEMPAALLAGVGASAWMNLGLGSATFDQVIVAPGTPYETFYLGDENPPQGVVLTSGTRLFGEVIQAREGKLALKEQPLMEQISPAPKPAQPGQPPPPHTPGIPLERVAWAVFAPLPPDVEKIVGDNKSGVLLADGQMVPSEIQDLWMPNNYLRVNSLMLGPKDFWVRPGVLGVMFHRVSGEGAAYEVRLRDGSVLYAKAIAVEPDGVAVDEPVLGKLTVPIGEVSEIRGR